jgi:hypothetical protein
MAYYSDEYYKKVAPNFLKFIDELEGISRKYGVAVSGNFDLTDNPEEFKDIYYDRDYTSGDIRCNGYWEDA